MLLKIKIDREQIKSHVDRILDKLLSFGLNLYYIDKRENIEEYYFDFPETTSEIELVSNLKYDLVTQLIKLSKEFDGALTFYLVNEKEAEKKTAVLSFANEEVEIHAFLHYGTRYAMGETISMDIHFTNKMEKPLEVVRKGPLLFTIIFYDINGSQFLTLTPRGEREERFLLQPNETIVEKTKIDTHLLKYHGLYKMQIKSPDVIIGGNTTFYLTEPIWLKVLLKEKA